MIPALASPAAEKEPHLIRNVAPSTDPAPPRKPGASGGHPGDPARAAEEFAQDLKEAEANNTSFEHSLPYHRLLAAELLAKGYVKLPAPADPGEMQDLTGPGPAAASSPRTASGLGPDHPDSKRFKMSVLYIQITEADHAANAFHVLGGAGFRTDKETRKHWDVIPSQPHEEGAAFDYMADLLSADGSTIVADKPISAATAVQLLRRPLEDARREALEDEAAVEARAKTGEAPASSAKGQQQGHGNSD